MSAITDFYRGYGMDDKGRTFDDYMMFTDLELESIHDYIQWLFPNARISSFNADAPMLTDDDIEVFVRDQGIRKRVKHAYARMFMFYSLSDRRQKLWVTHGNHNYLRLTRMLMFLQTIRMFNESHELFKALIIVFASNQEIVGKTTLQYWLAASES